LKSKPVALWCPGVLRKWHKHFEYFQFEKKNIHFIYSNNLKTTAEMFGLQADVRLMASKRGNKNGQRTTDLKHLYSPKQISQLHDKW